MLFFIKTIGFIVFGYLAFGLLFNFCLFLWALVQQLDTRHKEWEGVLHTVDGMIYFHVFGSVFWLPTLVSLRKEKVKKKLLILYRF
jgi:hypothetical protein